MKLDIDWDWVRAHLKRAERLPAEDLSGSKRELLLSVEECLKKAKRLAAPKFIFTEKKVATFLPNGIELEGGVVLSGRSIPSYMKGAHSVCIFLVTIGRRLEDTASLLMNEGDHLNGYLIDRIASFAVESLAEKFEQGVREYRKNKDESVSMRLSPGYCDWPIEEQFTLAKILDFSKAGVSLTETIMMIPKKSISAMVAIGHKGLFKEKISQCSICDKNESCDYRRIC